MVIVLCGVITVVVAIVVVAFVGDGGGIVGGVAVLSLMVLL